MSLTKPYLPNADNDRVTWMNNFNAKLPGVYILKAKINEKQYNFKVIKTNGN
ncbi:MAG: hypothetical protein HYX39_11650 [Bacteroidetes bacterium]|nr:hypothetical protein [Bacteroidota bacterium]